ncbi:ribulose-phosphate 3-epimerase [Mycoplasma procyoni]|uniref:ribulose-phosphate 3-epimerase n=1 Tax=Mycoplasma procyoni TaxID=568784 RepID=UPI00197B30D6|nr:ribulose-phosphate 3-epimerase [Mycoplasma procyoni]MBN3534427.1 ribulose-phosphate 3-epimerase [Mycoplasma procyoni]
MQKISPSLLSIDKDNRIKSAKEMFDLGVEWIHYDYMDAKFVPNRAIELEEIINIKNNTQKHTMDIHIMAYNPQEIVDQMIGVVDYATVHYEVFENKNALESFIKENKGKIKLGISIKPNTDFEEIKDVLKDFDLLLIMSVEPGAGGQKFIENSLEKIKNAREFIDQNNLNIVIQVDGGINNLTGYRAFEAGADLLVSGSYLTINPSKQKYESLFKKEN